MTNAGIIDDFLKLVYLDPLIESGTTDFGNDTHRLDVIKGDELMHSYIQKLDEEIFSDPPILEPSGVDQWEEENLSDMFIQLNDYARTLGWAVVQFYKEAPVWRVFTKFDLKEWIQDEKKNIIGAKFNLSNAVGTATIDCLFGVKQCYILKFKEGNNKDVFAYPDISEALWTSATISRQIRNQLDVMCAKPEFPWVTYGTNITPAQREAVLNAIDNASITNGLAATKNAVEDVRFISHTLHQELMDALDKRGRGFAGLTRLPYAFYNGERESSGLGEKGELIVEMKIDKRKSHIFNKNKKLIRQLFAERYNIALTNIEMDLNQVDEEEVQPTP